VYTTQHFKSLFFLDISFDDIGYKILVLSQRVFMGGHVNCSVIMINGFLAGKLVPAYTGCREGWCIEKQQGWGGRYNTLLFSVRSLTPSHSLFSTLLAARFQF